MTIDISNFYLNTPMDRYEYMRMKSDMFPEDVIQEYNLRDKVEPNGYVYIEFVRVCTGYPKRDYSHRNSSKKDLRSMVTNKAR